VCAFFFVSPTCARISPRPRPQYVNYTACDASKGVRSKVTHWVRPKTCNSTSTKAEALSKYPPKTEPCPGCAPGYHR
jgi:hypothetical protein